MMTPPKTQAELEPISPKEARAAIQRAIIERLGEQWQDEDHGWVIIHDADYLMRLTRGKVNLDFYCDLLGEVTVTESPLSPVQASGALIAWMVLGFSMGLALLLAWIAGAFR